MPLESAGREIASEAIQTNFPFLSLHDGTGTEITGGSPAYARIDISGSMSSNDDGTITITGPITFDIPSGATVAKFGIYTLVTGGSRGGLEDLSASEGPYAAQGQYQFTSGSITVT
jgi:hypothetical protein